MDKVDVCHTAAESLLAAYERTLPMETAGFLLGSERHGKALASEVLLIRSSTGRDAFDVPDHELRRARAFAEDRRLRILALFHSHPSGDSRLSTADRATLRRSEWPFVIVTRVPGRRELEFTAYHSDDAGPTPLSCG